MGKKQGQVASEFEYEGAAGAGLPPYEDETDAEQAETQPQSSRLDLDDLADTYRANKRAISALICVLTNTANTILAVALVQKVQCMACSTRGWTTGTNVLLTVIILLGPLLSLVDGAIVWRQFRKPPAKDCNHYSSQFVEDASLIFGAVAMLLEFSTGADFVYVAGLVLMLVHIAYIAWNRKQIVLYPGRSLVLIMILCFLAVFFFGGISAIYAKGEMVYLAGYWTDASNGTTNSTEFCSSALVTLAARDERAMTCETQQDGCAACVRFKLNLAQDEISFGLQGEACANAYNFTATNLTTWKCDFWGARTVTTHSVVPLDCAFPSAQPLPEECVVDPDNVF